MGVNAQLLKIIIPAGPAHLLVRQEAHHLYGLLPADVRHEYIPSGGILRLCSHGLGPLCGRLPPTALPIRHHGTVCHQCCHLHPPSQFAGHTAYTNSGCQTQLLCQQCGGKRCQHFYSKVSCGVFTWISSTNLGVFGACWVLIWPLSCYPIASSWESGRPGILSHSSLSETIMFPVFFHGILSDKCFMMIPSEIKY